MTTGFLISFGGLFLVLFLLAAAVFLLKPRRRPMPPSLDALLEALDDAERAVLRLQSDLTRARAQLKVIEK